MKEKVRIYKMKDHARWVAARVDGNLFLMGHTWESVMRQLRQYVLVGVDTPEAA